MENVPQNDKNRMKAHNFMQIELVKKFYGFEIGNEQMLEWLNKYSKSFRKIVAENPHLLDKFSSENQEESKSAIEYVEHLLYSEVEV